MARTRAFISFDFDHDDDLKVMLVGQAANTDTPFAIVDRSIKEPLSGDWKEKVRSRIRNRVDVVVVICGEHTNTATGVAAEVGIAQEEKVPYFLLWGRPKKNCVKPTSAYNSDQIYEWTWENLKALIGGSR